VQGPLTLWKRPWLGAGAEGREGTLNIGRGPGEKKTDVEERLLKKGGDFECFVFGKGTRVDESAREGKRDFQDVMKSAEATLFRTEFARGGMYKVDSNRGGKTGEGKREAESPSSGTGRCAERYRTAKRKRERKKSPQ